MAADKYVIPTHLDDPELIGLWTLDEFLAMVIPFAWGILSQHILIGMALSGAGWWGLRKAKAGRATSWLLHLAYWYLPRSEEHTSELQSLMRISYAVFCLKKQNQIITIPSH